MSNETYSIPLAFLSCCLSALFYLSNPLFRVKHSILIHFILFVKDTLSLLTLLSSGSHVKLCNVVESNSYNIKGNPVLGTYE